MSRSFASLTDPNLGRCCTAHDDWQQLTTHLKARFAQVPAAAVDDEIDRARTAMDEFDLDEGDQLDVGEKIIRNNLLMRTGQIQEVARLDPESHLGRTKYDVRLTD